MIHNVRKTGQYQRQRSQILDDIKVAANLENKRATAIANRLTGTIATPAAETDRRTPGEKRLDLLYQQDVLRRNLLSIMTAEEVGVAMDRIGRNPNPLKMVTLINQQWNGIKIDLKKIYTDVSPTIFMDFIRDYMAAAQYGDKKATDIVGTKGAKMVMVDHIMRSLTTFHINMDTIIASLRHYLITLRRKPNIYNELTDDFQYLIQIMNLIPLPSDPVRERLTMMGKPALDVLDDNMASFPSIAQCNAMLGEFFQTDGALRVGKKFSDLMKRIMTLFQLPRNVTTNIMTQFRITPIAPPPIRTDTEDHAAIDMSRILQDAAIIGDPVDLDMVSSYPVIADVSDTAPPPPPPILMIGGPGPGAAAVAAAAGAAGAAAAGAAGAAPVYVEPIAWYRPPTGWSFDGESFTDLVTKVKWDSVIAELEDTLMTPAKLTELTWDRTSPDQRTIGWIVGQFQSRFLYASQMDQRVATHITGQDFASLFDALSFLELDPNQMEQFRTDVAAAYDADPDTAVSGYAVAPIDPFEWFALVPPDRATGTYDATIATWGSLPIAYIKSNFELVADFFGIDPATYSLKGKKTALLSRLKVVLDNNAAAIALSDQQQQDARNLSDPSGTSIEYAINLIREGKSIPEPWLSIGQGLDADIAAAAAARGPVVGLLGGFGESLFDQVEPVAATAPAAVGAAEDHQGDLAAMGAPELQQQTALPGEVPVAPGEVEGSGLRTRVRRPQLRAIIGRGVAATNEPRYREFGRNVINMEHLRNGRLCLRHRGKDSFISVNGFGPIRPISHGAASVLGGLICTGDLDGRTFVALDDDEKDLIAQALRVSGLSNAINLPMVDRDMDRFKLIKQHILAGGNAPDELKEFKDLIFRFIRQGRIGLKAGMGIIEEVNDLS